jgi:hypothetical protein
VSQRTQYAVNALEQMFPDWARVIDRVSALLANHQTMEAEHVQFCAQVNSAQSTRQGGGLNPQGFGQHDRKPLNVSQFTKTLLKWSGGQARDGSRTDPTSWLYKFNSLATIEKLTDDERGQVIVFLLEGAALDWYNSQTELVRNNWPTLSQQFLNEYTVRNEQEEAAMKIGSIRESDDIAGGKTFRQFQDAFRGLCNKAGASATESQRVQGYIMAMQSDLMREEMMKDFLSSKKLGAKPLQLHEVIEMSKDRKLATQAAHRVPIAVQQLTRANMGGGGPAMGAGAQAPSSEVGSAGPSVSQVGIYLDALHAMQQRHFPGQTQASVPNQNSSRNNGHSEVSVNTAHSSLASLSARMSEIQDSLLSFNEGRSRPGSGNGSAIQKETRECYNCGIKGHLAKDCLKPPRNGASKSRSRSRSQDGREDGDRNSSGQYEKRGKSPNRSDSPGGRGRGTYRRN